MQGDRVCIAGVTEELECVRPVVDDGVRIWSLYQSRKPVIFPSAKVWMDLSPAAKVVPPHIEDRTYQLDSIEYKDRFKPKYWELLLSKISCRSVSDIFDGNLDGRRIAPGTKTRSLGTIKNVKILDLQPEKRGDRTVLRLAFEDESGAVHERFPVNDLAFRGMFDKLSSSRLNLPAAANEVFSNLKRADRVYLRIGLARPTVIGEYEEACWAQVTGVYTFPDYLGGKTWADFQ